MPKPNTCLKDLIAQILLAKEMGGDASLIDEQSSFDLLSQYDDIGMKIIEQLWSEDEVQVLTTMLASSGLIGATSTGQSMDLMLLESLVMSRSFPMQIFVASILKFALGIAVSEEIR